MRSRLRAALATNRPFAVQIERSSKREAGRRFGIDPKTVDKMMAFSAPPGYRRTKPPVRPKLDPFVAIIDKILADDKTKPKKQQHTAKRIFERLRDEHGFTGGITIVKRASGEPGSESRFGGVTSLAVVPPR